METRASYMIVGAFTLLAVIGAVIFVLWTAGNDKGKMRTYEVEFNQSVSGLSVGSAVLLEGVRIGQVTRIRVSPNDPGTVQVLVSIVEDAPIRKNSEATLEPQGVTGVSAVAVSGGTADAPLLVGEGGKIPQIPSRPSKLQEIMNSVPSILAQLDTMVTKANDLVSSENIQGLGKLITSVSEITQTVAAERESIAKAIKGFGDAGQSFSVAGKRLERLMASAQTIIDKEARGALKSIDKAATRFDKVVGTVEPGMTRFSRESVDELHRLLIEARRLMGSLAKLSQKLESDPRRFLLGNQVPEFSAK